MAHLQHLGIGSYYAAYYAAYACALALGAAALLILRRRLPRWLLAIAWALLLLLANRIVLFENPVALRLYQRYLRPDTVGLRQWDTISLEINKYRRNLHPGELKYLAVGSSQVGAIFSYWTSDRPEPVQLFSLAGMRTLDYVLYEDYIAAYRPQAVILYVSGFDLASGPELRTLLLAPSRPLEAPALLARMHCAGLGLLEHAEELHQFLAAQFFPEYRFNFIFRQFFKDFIQRRTGAVQTAAIVQPARIVRAAFEPGANPLRIPPEHIAQFVSYLQPEWVDFNFFFLREFLSFCKSRHIAVVIAEGQINPIVTDPKVIALNESARRRISEVLPAFPNVTYIPASALYEFRADEYRDLTHVTSAAAMRYTRRLSAYLDRSASGAPCTFQFAGGWHTVENAGADWFRWSDGSGEFRLRSRESADLLLEADLLSLVRPNQVDVIVNGKTVAKWTVSDLAWRFHPMPPVRFHVNGGEETIIQFSSQAPATTQPTDPRPLAIALKKPTIRSAAGLSCAVSAGAPSPPPAPSRRL